MSYNTQDSSHLRSLRKKDPEKYALFWLAKNHIVKSRKGGKQVYGYLHIPKILIGKRIKIILVEEKQNDNHI